MPQSANTAASVQVLRPTLAVSKEFTMLIPLSFVKV
jgi:hypothetical protein